MPFRGSRFSPILDMLASFKKGMVGGVKVHADRLQVEFRVPPFQWSDAWSADTAVSQCVLPKAVFCTDLPRPVVVNLLSPPLQTLISGAVVEQLDFLRISDTEE